MSLHLILDCLNRERVRCTYGAVGAVIGESARGVSRHLEAKDARHKRTAAVFAGHAVRRLPAQIQPRARSKLLAIDSAVLLDDLRAPPGNRLEALSGDRRGQHAIRINDQWRICFVWRKGEAWSVEIVDYH